MEFEKLITERFSVRKFKNEHLSEEILNKILEAALIVMGYAAEDAKPMDLHFETRPISDVVFYDTF